ncbi:Flp pilus assembly protein CpaB [Novosphingobium lentum]|uniref:Flp pilus assembly protein CpaB n=1 Tax=Novosphingobium lentum TaxID=145287 RepID=UPI000834178B|nr:Flp pilus assembly protein CpaB [Novosphingobium lentum]
MDKKKLMLLLGALIIAIGTGIAARSLFLGASSPQAEAAAKAAKGPKVMVAQRALPVGTIITADAIGFQEWPKEMVQDAYFIEGQADMSKMLGTVVRFPITAGEPVTQGSLVAPGDRGFLAAALSPGMRAVTIPVSARTGVAGFVFPGDHIDLVLTQSVKATDSGMPLKASETILKNLRVLATDQSTEQETVEGKTRVRTFSTVTVEVTPKIAEKIAVAQTIGTISLSLRSISDNSAELEQALATGEVKIPAGTSKADEEKLLKAAMNKPIDKSTTFVTGGDVSRFQRSSVPTIVPAAAPATFSPPTNYPTPSFRGGAGPVTVARGPIVHVTRGKTTEDVAVGGN